MKKKGFNQLPAILSMVSEYWICLISHLPTQMSFGLWIFHRVLVSGLWSIEIIDYSINHTSNSTESLNFNKVIFSGCVSMVIILPCNTLKILVCKFSNFKQSSPSTILSVNRQIQTNFHFFWYSNYVKNIQNQRLIIILSLFAQVFQFQVDTREENLHNLCTNQRKSSPLKCPEMTFLNDCV